MGFAMLEITDCLQQDGLLDAAAIPALLKSAALQKRSLITYLVRANILSSESILACCAKHFALPIYDMDLFDIAHLQTDRISIELMVKYRIIPIAFEETTFHVGIADPTDSVALSALRFLTGLFISPMLVSEAKLDKLLASLSRSIHFEQAISKVTPIEDPSSHYLLNEPDDGPISEFATQLLDDAISQRASDIHIEPYTEHCRIRFRCDGLLHEVTTTPPHFAARLITRLKVMSHLNIAERRLPQDGRLSLQTANMDVRINTCPTLSGEKIVLRLLDTNKIKLDVDRLGMTHTQKKIFLSKLTQPQGLILVTGPTGSGKTITLYSALHYLNQIEKNISSVEDPVEMELPGINQINVNPRIGLDFADVLRSLLRQDPDIIMIGEIRDTQTAAIAMQAAQTGHLVLSTLHTNNAIETITRLQSMDIAAHHFINAVSLIIAQRLVRKLCVHCKTDTNTPIGCKHCYQGYQDRIGVFELIPITEKIASHILSGANTIQLKKIIHEEQWMSLWESGRQLVQQGITSYAELLRIIGKDECHV